MHPHHEYDEAMDRFLHDEEELDDEAGIVSFRGRGHKSAMFERTVRFEPREVSPRKT
jgi:hypothetical protein